MGAHHYSNPVRNLLKAKLALALVSTLTFALTLAGCDSKDSLPLADLAPAAVTAPPIQPAQQAPPPRPAEPTAQQRKSQELIATVERAFQSGQAHYRKGQLPQAKADFDNAVDMMLASGMDLKADSMLSDEFNRILDAVNALEVEALKQGNGFAPNVEPTPADVANDVTFQADPNLVATAKAELATTKSDLPLVINDYVATYINFFAYTKTGHNTLLHSFQRAGRYKAMIQRVLREEGVPQDLIYLAVAESGFQPQAVNGRSGAGGMWQFMPHGDYGLARNGYVDERFDPEKSTRAYGRYMKFLYNQLGDWYLAMAAYDWGAGSIQRAVQKTGYADFWELYKRNNLPVETKNYVPEILAAIIIANNPKHYGFDDLQTDPAIVADTVAIDYAVDLRLVADVVNAEPQELLALNPGLLRLTTPPVEPPASFDLHLPAGTAAIFQQRIADVPVSRRNQWRYHRVAAGDSLALVARNYRVTPEQLAAANQLHVGDSLDTVDALVVPVPPPAEPAFHAEVYKAHRGDTLVKIADRFGVSLENLHRWNHMTGSSVVAGQRIRVSEPVKFAPRTRDRSHASKQSIASHSTSGKQAPGPRSVAKPASIKGKTPVVAKSKAASTTHKSTSASKAAQQNKSKRKK